MVIGPPCLASAGCLGSRMLLRGPDLCYSIQPASCPSSSLQLLCGLLLKGSSLQVAVSNVCMPQRPTIGVTTRTQPLGSRAGRGTCVASPLPTTFRPDDDGCWWGPALGETLALSVLAPLIGNWMALHTSFPVLLLLCRWCLVGQLSCSLLWGILKATLICK